MSPDGIRFEFDDHLLSVYVRALPDKLHLTVRQAIQMECMKLATRVKDHYLSGYALHVRSGLLRRRTTWRIIDSALKIVGVVGTNTPYAAIHEFGGQTKPHIIRPKNRKLLAWFNQGGRIYKNGKNPGQGERLADPMIYAREVHHPGSRIPARPYMRPALADRSSMIVRALREATGKAML
jgi:phage gpG-like protein